MSDIGFFRFFAVAFRRADVTLMAVEGEFALDAIIGNAEAFDAHAFIIAVGVVVAVLFNIDFLTQVINAEIIRRTVILCFAIIIIGNADGYGTGHSFRTFFVGMTREFNTLAIIARGA